MRAPRRLEAEFFIALTRGRSLELHSPGIRTTTFILDVTPASKSIS